MGAPYSKEISEAMGQIAPLVAEGSKVLAATRRTSKEISTAMDQVVPLMAEGFQVLAATKKIAVVLVQLEILTAVMIALNLVCMVALLITLNPDLETE